MDKPSPACNLKYRFSKAERVICQPALSGVIPAFQANSEACIGSFFEPILRWCCTILRRKRKFVGCGDLSSTRLHPSSKGFSAKAFIHPSENILSSGYIHGTNEVRIWLFASLWVLNDVPKFPVDHTLSLLATAAVSRGLTHKITRNLKWLRQNHVLWVEKSYYAHRHYWKPQLPQTSEKFLPYPLPKPGSRPDLILRNNRKMRLFDEQCSNAIGEVVKMAEGRHGIILGRLHLKRWKHEQSPWLCARNRDLDSIDPSNQDWRKSTTFFCCGEFILLLPCSTDTCICPDTILKTSKWSWIHSLSFQDNKSWRLKCYAVRPTNFV